MTKNVVAQKQWRCTIELMVLISYWSSILMCAPFVLSTLKVERYSLPSLTELEPSGNIFSPIVITLSVIQSCPKKSDSHTLTSEVVSALIDSEYSPFLSSEEILFQVKDSTVGPPCADSKNNSVSLDEVLSRENAQEFQDYTFYLIEGDCQSNSTSEVVVGKFYHGWVNIGCSGVGASLVAVATYLEHLLQKRVHRYVPDAVAYHLEFKLLNADPRAERVSWSRGSMRSAIHPFLKEMSFLGVASADFWVSGVSLMLFLVFVLVNVILISSRCRCSTMVIWVFVATSSHPTGAAGPATMAFT
jgi:hypothetical protein